MAIRVTKGLLNPDLENGVIWNDNQRSSSTLIWSCWNDDQKDLLYFDLKWNDDQRDLLYFDLKWNDDQRDLLYFDNLELK